MNFTVSIMEHRYCHALHRTFLYTRKCLVLMNTHTNVEVNCLESNYVELCLINGNYVLMTKDMYNVEKQNLASPPNI